MTPGAQSLLADLRAAGMEVASSTVPGKVHVHPLSALTPARRQAILTHKTELLAALELESRIKAMAVRWQADAEELAEALDAAGLDPAAWMAACLWDAELAALAERAGRQHPPVRFT